MSLRKVLSVAIILSSALGASGVGAASAQQAPSVVTGRIDSDTPFVEVPLTVARDGSFVTLDLRPTSGNLDTLLYLVDSTGAIVAENDDRSREDYSSRIEFPQADAGQYTAIATRYGVADGDTEGEFSLSVEISASSAAQVAAYRTAPEDLLAARYPPVEPRPEADWTILAYYGGDTNLEAGILNDFKEFEIAGGSDDNVRIIMLLDRHPEFFNYPNNDWRTVRVFEVGPDITHDEGQQYPPTIDSQPLADLGVVDTGSGETLAQFLVWAIRSFPAQHYAVTLGSHGAGWEGLITDEHAGQAQGGGTILSIPELTQAFKVATETAGVKKFDLLINDACLMSSIEYYAAMSRYFRYSLASPEIVIDPALDMTLFTEALKKDPKHVNLVTLGEELVNTYITRDILLKESADNVFFTSAMTNLDQFDPVVAATERFAGIINARPAVFSKMLGEARSNTYTYTFFMGGNTKVDLGHFMRQVILLTDDAELILAAQDVLTALDAARIYGSAGERAARRTTYYNIYFPEDSASFRATYFVESPLQEWAKMLRNYFNAVTPQVWSGDPAATFHAPVAPKVRVTGIYPEVGSVTTPFSVELEIVGRNIALGRFIVDQIQTDGTAIRLESNNLFKWSPDLTRVDSTGDWVNQWNPVTSDFFRWNPTLPVVTDGVTRSNETLIRSGESGEVYSLEGRYREPGSAEWSDVAALFSFADGTLQRVVSRNPGSDALGVIRVPPGSEFQAYRQIVTPDGRVTLEPGTLYTWPEGGLRWERAPAPSGRYNLGFLITTFGGTTGFNSVTVTVNNDNLTPGVVGYTNTGYGITFSYPADWFDVASYEGYLVSTSPDRSAAVLVYIIETDDPRLDTIVNELLQRYEMTLTSALTPVAVANRGALEFDISYSGLSGRCFAIYRDDLDVGLVFSAQARDDADVDFEPIYQLLRSSAAFFDLSASSTALWDVDKSFSNAAHNVQFPVPKRWIENTRTHGDIWRGYASTALRYDPTFALAAWTVGDDASATLDRLLATYVAAETQGYQLEDRRTYYGENHTWEAARYTAARIGQPVTGRMYVTVVDGLTYAMWFETPTDDQTAQIFAEIFEPMLDGFTAESVDLTPYANGEYGFKLQYPILWSEMRSVGEQMVETGDPDGSALIHVYPVPGAPSDLEAIAAEVLDSRGITLDGEFTSITVDGQEALAFSLRYETPEGRWKGAAFAVYRQDRELGLVFSAEVYARDQAPEGTRVIGGQDVVIYDLPPGDACTFTLVNEANEIVIQYNPRIGANGALIQPVPEGGPFFWTVTCPDAAPAARAEETDAVKDYEAVYRLLLNTVQFWSVETVGETTLYPVRHDWLPGVEAGIWRRYAPGGDPASAAFVAITRQPTSDDPDTVLENVATEYVVNVVEDFQVVKTRTHFAENHAWALARYTAKRNNQLIDGGMYVTVVDGEAYVLWAEAPVSDFWQLYQSVFESMLIGLDNGIDKAQSLS